MIDYLTEYFNKNEIDFSQHDLNSHQIKEISKNRFSFDTMQFNKDEKNSFFLFHPYLHKVKDELLEKNLNVKNHKKIAKKDLETRSSVFIISDEVANHKSIYIGYQDTRKFLKINTSELNKFNNLEIATISENKKYKTRIRQVFPESEKKNIGNYKKCFLGFSVGNDEFKGEKLHAMLKLIDSRFDDCVIFVGDYLYRNTLQILNKNISSEKEALEECILMGNDLENNLNLMCSSFSIQFTIMRSSDMIRSKKYYEYLNIFQELFKSNRKFHASAFRFSKKFLSRNFKHTQMNIDLSIKYLLEELAFFALLIEKGYHVMLYPGDLECLIDIASNKIDGAPKIYDNFIKVVLKNCAR